MKKMAFFLGVFFFGFVGLALTQPDPRDSVILESKSVLPGSGYPAFTMTVYITSKDSLKSFMLVYGERALEGDVRAVEHERCCQWQFVNYLTNTLRYRGACFPGCTSADAETVITFGYSGFNDPSTIEPPNAVRKVFWELKFDTASVGGHWYGGVELDTGTVVQGTKFTNTVPVDLPVNFVKSQVVVHDGRNFDPRDSVILESKTVPAGVTGSGGIVRLKVYITNKDSLTYLTLVLRERTTSGGAYMNLSTPRSWDGVVQPLTNTLRYSKVTNFTLYNNSSPDRFLVGAGFDPALIDPPNGDSVNESIEPPNAARKAVWEIKFDQVLNAPGTIEFDTAATTAYTTFTNSQPASCLPNFLKAVVTVGLKGDLNLDATVSPADVVWELLCVIGGDTPPSGRSFCDLNCDGEISPADIVVMLTYKFVTLTWPC